MYKSLVFGDECLAQGLHLKSHQKCSAGIGTARSCTYNFLFSIFVFYQLCSENCIEVYLQELLEDASVHILHWQCDHKSKTCAKMH